LEASGGTVVLIGNPKPGSRTRAAAILLVRRLTGSDPAAVLELSELGPALLDRRSPEVAAAKAVVAGATLVVVASPTFKATYTGLLKLFLEQFGAGELVGVRAVALMLGGAPQHALAAELTLKPVLSEVGFSCPTPGLFLLDSDYESPAVIDAFVQRARIEMPDLVR
jgi:FMN reductase